MRIPPFVLLAAALLAGCEVTNPDAPGNLVPLTVTEDASLPAIDMNGSRFHVQTFGNPSNPVVIFLHGGPGNDYRSMLPLGDPFGGSSLADDYFLVFWDQRGSGLSERVGRSTLTIAQYDADLDALIDRYSAGRSVFLVGESWGGMFATEYINNHPAKVRGAVLIEPGPLTGAMFEARKKEITSIDLFSEGMNDVAWASQFISPDTHIRKDYDRLIGWQHVQPRSHESNRAPIWRFGAAASEYIMKSGQNSDGVAVYDFTTNLSQFTTPVLFITGALSEILGKSLQDEQMNVYPSASLVVIDDAGHDVFWIKAAQVVGLIRAYLGGL